MNTGVPEQDAQDHLKRQEEFDSTDECELCNKTVDSDEIRAETNYFCISCQEIDLCDCGVARDQCEVCSLPYGLRWTYNFKPNAKYWINKLTFNTAQWLWYKLKI